MKVFTARKERPLLLVIAVGTMVTTAAAAAGGSIFFTVTPPAYADDLTEEDLLSLQVDQLKVTICHIPPGEPENRHTITIGASAVASHVRNHGDPLGACQPVQPD
jgi:hypothetical protein